MKDNEAMSRKIAMCHFIKTAGEIEMATWLRNDVQNSQNVRV